MVKPKHIVVIGTSVGGLNALSILFKGLDPEADAAFFVVMHVAKSNSSDFLIRRLQPLTKMICEKPFDNMEINKGHIYIASPDYHLIVKKDQLFLGKGTEENFWKPSINVLFRSAAAAYGSAVTGILLTGMLDDGLAGMQAIQKCGGTCIVQDPNEAEYNEMPVAVLTAMNIDFCVPLNEMGAILTSVIEKEPADHAIPPEVILEADIAEKVVTGYDNLQLLGTVSLYSCPDCGGGLFEINNETGTDRFRCHIGHAYSDLNLAVKESETIQSTLWIALRIMEERKTLLQRMELKNENQGFAGTAFHYREKGIDMQFHIDRLKELLFSTQ